MKNIVVTGVVIGVLSGLWLFLMHMMGYDTAGDKVSPFEYFSILIPIVGLFFGLKSYRDNDLGGKMGFLEALMHSFQILLVGGVIAIFAAIVYINYFLPARITYRTFQAVCLAPCLLVY